MMRFSICITVYNQIELLKANIESLLSSGYQDVEFIVSDNCSETPNEELVNSYADPRLKFIRTPKNVGQDMNILYALRHCSGEYALVLRTKDLLLPGGIEAIIRYFDKYPDASYYLFSAVDEHKNPKLILSDTVYPSGREAAVAHTKLPIHPSGCIFALKYLDLDLAERYIARYFDHNMSVCVYELLRMQASARGPFVTSSSTVWQYTNTDEVSGVSMNATSTRIPFNAPAYEYERYGCEFDFVRQNFDENIQEIFLPYIVKRFDKSICFDFNYSNKNPNMQRYYSFDKIEYSARKEKRVFREYSDRLFKDLPDGLRSQLEHDISRQHVLMVLWYPIKRRIIRLLNELGCFASIVRIVKNI